MIEHQDCYWPCPAVVRPGSSPLCVWMGRVFFEWEHNIPDAAAPLFTRPSALPDLNTCRCYYTRYEQRTAVNTFVVVVMKALTTCQSHVASCTATLLGVRRCEDGCRPSTPWSTCVSTHSPTLTFSMNGDMPHVPITTLAGIASLTDCEWHSPDTLPQFVYYSSSGVKWSVWIQGNCLFHMIFSIIMCSVVTNAFFPLPCDFSTSSTLPFPSSPWSHHSVEPAAPPLSSPGHHH